VLGLSACGLGLAGLLLPRGKRPRPLALAALLGLGGSAAALAGLPPYTWVQAWALAGIGLIFACCGSRLPLALATACARPWAQSGALLLAGCTLIAWQACAMDGRLETDLRETDAHLASQPEPAALEEVAGVVALTDSGRRVPLLRVPAGTRVPREDADIRLGGLSFGLIQTAPASLGYNCHGWLFTGGKHLLRGRSVELILRDNRYRAVTAPAAGDLAVFRNLSGALTHTALVRGLGEGGTVLLESKWGGGGRYIHTAARHIYAEDACTYYRTSRGGHLLRLTSADEQNKYHQSTTEPSSSS
jgi:hypothetical protein